MTEHISIKSKWQQSSLNKGTFCIFMATMHTPMNRG
jgi:hypothetical protein